jgi:hypothetical protein
MAVALHDELVRDTGRHHDDVPRPSLDRVSADDESHLSTQHDEDFLVGVAVKARTVALADVAEEDRDLGAVVVAVKDLRALAAGKFVDSDHTRVGQWNVRHAASGWVRGI